MNETENDIVDIVGLLLKGKTGNTLNVIQTQLDNVTETRNKLTSEITLLETSAKKVQEKIKRTSIPYEQAITEKTENFKIAIGNIEKKITESQDKKQTTETQLGLQDDEKRIQLLKKAILDLEKNITQAKTQLSDIQEKKVKVFKEINDQREDFVQALDNNIHESNAKLKLLKAKNSHHHHEQLILDNLHHAATKNPKTIFNDNVKHDLALFAHKDKEFGAKLNLFFNETFEVKGYQSIIDKIGDIIGQIQASNAKVNIIDLVAIYNKLFDRIKSDGIEILDKPISQLFLAPEVQKMLDKLNKNLSISELLQLAKLDKDIHENVFIHSICIDFYISLMRAEAKNAAKKKEAFRMPEIKWEGLLFMTKQWPIFFRKFGESLKAFDELQYIRIFKESMDIANEVVKNPTSHKILNVVLGYRRKRKGTYKNNMSIQSYITLFHDTVIISRSNSIRNPHYKEVLETQKQLEGVTRLSFLNLFSVFDVNRMQTQEENMQESEKENIFLKFNDINLQNEVFLKTLKVKDISEVPIALKSFLKSLPIDVDDHFKHMENIIEKEEAFTKNIQKSIISSDKQLPLVNDLYESVLKCCEYVDSPKALEDLIISNELRKALDRRANSH